MGYECFTSASDLEAQHSITFTAYKNMPINVVAYTKMAAEIIFTTSVFKVINMVMRWLCMSSI